MKHFLNRSTLSKLEIWILNKIFKRSVMCNEYDVNITLILLLLQNASDEYFTKETKLANHKLLVDCLDKI
jgi:hypothetical protein